ncbi:MAG: hypothetical protein J4F28_09630, partial [Nitrosopumilaceae archaeon]|nr:hypothetical protein [Nitrosopumilaceae archaeon]
GTVVTGTTTTNTYDLNGTSIVRGPDGEYLAVSNTGGGGGGDDSDDSTDNNADAESESEQDDTESSCGSGTETFAAYAERIVRQAVSESSQQDSGPSGIVSLPRELTREPEANHIRLFLQPSTVTPLSPYSEAHGIVGFYYVDQETPETAVLESDDLVITTSTEYERIMPVRTEYERITITASSAPGSERGGGGLDVRPLHVSHPTFHTNAYEFPMQANLEGTYDVSAVSGGYMQNATLHVVPPYETDYHLNVTALPARSDAHAAAVSGNDGGGEHPLFLVSIIDDAGRIIDVHEEFGEPRTVRA